MEGLTACGQGIIQEQHAFPDIHYLMGALLLDPISESGLIKLATLRPK